MESIPNTGEGESMSDCDCKLEGDLFLMCDEHKQELATLKNNPPYWAIRARGRK
jgi:hypothetical protein